MKESKTLFVLWCIGYGIIGNAIFFFITYFLFPIMGRWCLLEIIIIALLGFLFYKRKKKKLSFVFICPYTLVGLAGGIVYYL